MTEFPNTENSKHVLVPIIDPSIYHSDTSIVKLSELPIYAKACFMEDASLQLQAAIYIRKLLATQEKGPIEEVIDSGVVGRIIQFLKSSPSNKIIYESLWIVSNIVSGTAANTAYVLRYDILPTLVDLMSSSSKSIQEQAIWAIGNIAGDGPACRNLCLSHNVLQSLQNICCNNKSNAATTLSLLRTTAWLLSNLCRGKPAIDFKYFGAVIEIASTMLVTEKYKFDTNNQFYKLVWHFIASNYDNIPNSLFILILTYYPTSDTEIVSDICWAFSYLTDFDETEEYSLLKMKMIINCGAVAPLIDILLYEQPNSQIVTAAVRSVGNLVALNDAFVAKVIGYGVLNAFNNLLHVSSCTIQREICWVLSNIVATTKQWIEAVIAANLIPKMVELMCKSKYAIAKEAAWVIANITTHGSDEQIAYIVLMNCIAAICHMLKHNESKSQSFLLCLLEGLENILVCGDKQKRRNDNNCNMYAVKAEESGAIELLEMFQCYENTADYVYDKCVSIIRTYYAGESEEEEYQQNYFQEWEQNQVTMNDNELFQF